MTLDLHNLRLDEGAHSLQAGLACVMEAAAYIGGEDWTDAPACVSPPIATFLRLWNDGMDSIDRQTLLRYLVCEECGDVHTRDADHAPDVPLLRTGDQPEADVVRSWMAFDWLVRDYTPRWLHLAGLNMHAEQLAGLPPVDAATDMAAAHPAIDAARDAARDAAGVAAGDETGAAARDATKAAAGVAARDAAWVASRDAADHTSRVAAGAAAWNAARAAAETADRLTPTITECQESAHRLIDRMIATAR